MSKKSLVFQNKDECITFLSKDGIYLGFVLASNTSKKIWISLDENVNVEILRGKKFYDEVNGLQVHQIHEIGQQKMDRVAGSKRHG